MAKHATKADWDWASEAARPLILASAEPDFLDVIAARLHEAGVQDAVRRRDSAPIYTWLMTLVPFQGVSDRAALAFDAAHGGVSFAQVAAAFGDSPSCPRLRCYWTFERCGYRKSTGRCAEPNHVGDCPLPTLPLRKGGIQVAAASLFLFIRDICNGDIVAWLDHRLAAADPGRGAPDRATRMQAAVLDPLVGIVNTGPKLWSMMLAELLLGGDPERERWLVTGACLIAVDTLIHNCLHRLGILRRLGMEHHYGACYGPNGCADIINKLAQCFDARSINPQWPSVFPRLVQHSLWRFCSTSEGVGKCSGIYIDDSQRCHQIFCPAGKMCARVQLR